MKHIVTDENIEAIKNVVEKQTIIDLRLYTVYIMRNSGCTYTEIGKAFEITRQRAEHLYKRALKEI